VLSLWAFVIGSGIFLVPGGVLHQCGDIVGLAALVWIVGGLLSVLGALSYAELGAMQPSAGGLYIYIREIFGERAAFLFGWSLFFIIGSGAIATLAVAFATYAGEFLQLSQALMRLVSVLLIVGLTAVNVLVTRVSLGFQRLTTCGKPLGLFALLILLVALGRANLFAVASHPDAMPGSLQ
jgi:APA family basic amino acid/polyamine antiporter